VYGIKHLMLKAELKAAVQSTTAFAIYTRVVP